MVKSLRTRLGQLDHRSWVLTNLFSLQQTSFFLDFLHDGNGPLLSILLVPLFGAPFDSEQMDRWLDFLFLYNPKIQAYFTFDDHACVQ
jgi:hypothetical protein